jgi:glutaredoxin 3
MVDVRVYTSRICWYCDQAKRLLDRREVPYRAIDVSDDYEARKWLVDVTGRRTVPQIFIGEAAIGGFTELAALERSGELTRMLEG